jgi:transcriptional regulator with XRE-family HTH domain
MTSSEPTDPEWVDIGRRLKQVREYLNLSQQVVAQTTGVPRSAISDIERGQRKIDSLELRKFARLYSYPVGYFLGDDGPADASVLALTRAVAGLTDDDKDEVIRFAQFLRFSAGSTSKRPK